MKIKRQVGLVLCGFVLCTILLLAGIAHAAPTNPNEWRAEQLAKLEAQKQKKLTEKSPQLETLEKQTADLTQELALKLGMNVGLLTSQPSNIVIAAQKNPLLKESSEKLEASYRALEAERKAVRDTSAIDREAQKLQSLSASELSFAYQQKYVVEEAQIKYNSDEQLLKISPNNPTRRAARDASLTKLQSERSKMYALEKESKVAQYNRESQQYGEDKGDLVQEATTIQSQLEAELNKPSPDPAKVKNLQSQLSTISTKVETLTKAEAQAQARVNYLEGKAGFAQTLTEVVEAYNEFSGLGALTSLFIDDKELQKRRDEANDLFCQSMLLGGVECWTSRLCEANADANIGGLSLISRTPQQDPRAAAHVESDVSQPITYINQSTKQSVTIRLYRITYFVNNPTDVNMSYNLIFKQSGGNDYAAFGNGKFLEPGASDAKLRANAIVKYSASQYTEVCLIFNPGIKRFGGGTTKELCAPIVEYAGGPTSIAQTGVQNQSQSSSGTTGGQPPADFGGF